MTPSFEITPLPHKYSKIPEPETFGYCHCCNKPMSEHDSMHSQGCHCAECFSNLVWDDNGFWCNLHEKPKTTHGKVHHQGKLRFFVEVRAEKPSEENTINQLIRDKAYKKEPKP